MRKSGKISSVDWKSSRAVLPRSTVFCRRIGNWRKCLRRICARWRWRPIVRRVAALETRLRVETTPGPDVELTVGPRSDRTNAHQSGAQCRGSRPGAGSLHKPIAGKEYRRWRASADPEVVMGWNLSEKQLVLTIEDNGPGLLNPSNAFVPFYTTKSSGSGIGLVLSPADCRGAWGIAWNSSTGAATKAVWPKSYCLVRRRRAARSGSSNSSRTATE